MSLLRLEIPMRLPSAANLREHWRVRAKRVKSQRAVVRLAMRAGCMRGPTGLDASIGVAMQGEPLVVRLTRISPRKLDSDNLSSAFKAIRDQVAAELGIDDGSDAIEWLYAQEPGRPGIRIEIAKALAETRVAP